MDYRDIKGLSATGSEADALAEVFKADTDALKAENERLKAEIARLKKDLFHALDRVPVW